MLRIKKIKICNQGVQIIKAYLEYVKIYYLKYLISRLIYIQILPIIQTQYSKPIVMNRVTLSVLSEKSNLRKEDIQVLSDVCQPRPLQNIWKSEKFAIFPLEIYFYLSNPPFNKISLSIPQQFRTKIEIFGSKNGKQYFKIEQVNQEKDDFDDYLEGGIVSKFFKESHQFNYLRLKFACPQHGKGYDNICRQVGIRAIQVSNIVYFNSQYLCSLRRRLELHPSIFIILQLLEYKTMMLEKQAPNTLRTKIKQKYIKRMKQIQDLLYNNKISSIHPKSEYVQKFNIQFEQLLQQPILEDQDLDFSSPVELKPNIKKLQKQLAQFYVDRLNNLEANVTNYFQKYWNNEIRDIYLRLISSPEDEDKTKALVQFWSEIKSLDSVPPNIEQATLMFLNYYLEFIQNTEIKIGAIKVLCIMLKLQGIGFKLFHIYQRILWNLINCLLLNEKQQTYKLAYKTIFTIYKKVPNSVFLKELLNRESHVKDQMKLKKLEILQKIVINDEAFQVDALGRDLIIEFLLDILLIKQLTVEQKNKAYNIVAFLASCFGKQSIMGDFQKLNSMLLMNMEKIIDKKLAQLKSTNPIQNGLSNEFRTMCDFCGQQRPQFKDDNIYDIHCYKECKMLIPCEHCSCIVQIPELNKHYLEECSLKNKFKNCDNCNDIIFIANQEEHKAKCTKNFVTKCALCQKKLQSKLKIKQHILKDGCPNNFRAQQKQ